MHGAVKLESYCDSPDVLAKMKNVYYISEDGSYKKFGVRTSSVQKDMVICYFDEIDKLEDAILLKGTVLYADRNDITLGDGSVFIADLIGLPVVDNETNETYGKLADVITPGGREIYVVREQNGKEFMIPAVPEFIKRINTDNDGGIYVHLIDGMREE